MEAYLVQVEAESSESGTSFCLFPIYSLIFVLSLVLFRVSQTCSYRECGF